MVKVALPKIKLNPFMHNVKNGQTYIKNLAVSAPQDLQNMFGNFSTFYIKRLFFLKKSSATFRLMCDL